MFVAKVQKVKHYIFLMFAIRTNITADKIVLRYEKSWDTLDLLWSFNNSVSINTVIKVEVNFQSTPGKVKAFSDEVIVWDTASEKSSFFWRVLTINMSIIAESYIKIELIHYSYQVIMLKILPLNRKHCKLYSFFWRECTVKNEHLRRVSPFRTTFRGTLRLTRQKECQ